MILKWFFFSFDWYCDWIKKTWRDSGFIRVGYFRWILITRLRTNCATQKMITKKKCFFYLGRLYYTHAHWGDCVKCIWICFIFYRSDLVKDARLVLDEKRDDDDDDWSGGNHRPVIELWLIILLFLLIIRNRSFFCSGCESVLKQNFYDCLKDFQKITRIEKSISIPFLDKISSAIV